MHSSIDTISNIKNDRSDLDIVFQCMINLGIELSANIEEKSILGKKVYCINGDKLIICLENNLTNEVIVEIAKSKPEFAIFKDGCFDSDAISINAEQIFATHSNSTRIRII